MIVRVSHTSRPRIRLATVRRARKRRAAIRRRLSH